MIVRGDIKKYIGAVESEEIAARFYDKYALIIQGFEVSLQISISAKFILHFCLVIRLMIWICYDISRQRQISLTQSESLNSLSYHETQLLVTHPELKMDMSLMVASQAKVTLALRIATLPCNINNLWIQLFRQNLCSRAISNKYPYMRNNSSKCMRNSRWATWLCQITLMVVHTWQIHGKSTHLKFNRCCTKSANLGSFFNSLICLSRPSPNLGAGMNV